MQVGARRAGVLLFLSLSKLLAQGTTPAETMNPQPYQRPEACLPCHQRQYDELASAVKAGYRSVSPLMNGLELASNFLTGGLLRPVYSDSTKVAADGTPLRSNFISTPSFTNVNQVQAGFCFGCHNPHIELMGDNPATRAVPELPGTLTQFQPDQIRPLRDYELVDSNGQQVLPATPGGPPPPGALPSLGAAAITCDLCHNMTGPDLNRSFQHDGFANMGLDLLPSMDKVGPFSFPVAPKNGFHVASHDPNRINFLRSSAFCNSCHDVRVPGNGSLTHEEHDINPGGENVHYFRLENLSTEWQTGPYNSTNNPFNQIVRCQDCHMSTFPLGGNSTYQIGNLTVTSPTPGNFYQDYAAVPGVSTDGGYPLQTRPVVNHYFTGVDVPLMNTPELQARLGSYHPDVNQPGVDTHGAPNALSTRRQALLDAAVRIDLGTTDATVKAGQKFTVRASAVALTGHRFPAGFSQERTAYIQLTVTDNAGLLLYQSGYQVDKPHPETGETSSDGNLDDEDLEHIHAIVDPGTRSVPYAPGAAENGHRNQLFELGPDSGPEARVFEGAPEGLVLFRNELTHVYLPGESLGRQDANGNPVVATAPHFEETFSAAFANSVDNFRSLAPLRPTTYPYEIQLPSTEELKLLGIQKIQSPLHVHAQINFEHFPPLFLRFLTRTTGANGPAGRDFQMLDEQTIDQFLVTIRGIASADTSVQVLP